MKKNRFIVISSIVISLIFIFRIVYINVSSDKILFLTHNMQEWITLDGSFFISNIEDTDGYMVKINDCTLTPLEEFLVRYNIDLATYEIENAFVLEVGVSINNTNNQLGSLRLSDWSVLNKSKNYITKANGELLGFGEPKLRGQEIVSVKIQPSTEYSLTIPFLLEDFSIDDFLQKESPFSIVITKYPTRNMVLLDNILLY